MSFRNAIFAGGGSRCFWQLGFWEGAKEAGLEGKWVFTLHRPSIEPFLDSADNRELRRQILEAYLARGSNGNEQDNREILTSIASLRAERAKLLIVAVEAPEKGLEIIETARKHFPQLTILARARGRPHAYDLLEAGVDASRICLDPGIGFGKTVEHNLALLSRCRQLLKLGCPVLVGHSRKGFLGHILGDKKTDRTAGTIGVAMSLAAQGVHVLRVHDVAPVKQALRPFLETERGRGHPVSHLDEVGQGQVGYGVGVDLALPEVGLERSLSIGRRRAQAVDQRFAILEPGVDALPVERHDRVGRIAQKQHAILVIPRTAPHRHQRADWILKVIVRQGRHQRYGITELPIE